MLLLAALATSLAAGDKPLMTAGAPRVFSAPASHLEFSKQRRAQPSLSLTASDETGLALVELEARTIVEDPLAFTELRLVFLNPELRRLEGRFEIALPPSASISRFAMRIGERWHEGEVVEKQKARRIYEDFLHRKQDPALLEQGAGNSFGVRVFPIEAGERKELVLSYSQELTTSRVTLVPVAGLPKLEKLSASLFFGGTGQAAGKLALDGQAPPGDLELVRGFRREVLRSAELAVTSVRAPDDGSRDSLDGMLLLVDTSASGALDWEARVAAVRSLMRALARGHGASPLALVAFDQSSETLFEGPAGDCSPAILDRLDARGALGATDLGAALAAVRKLAEGRRYRRVVLVGDGVASAGVTEPVVLAGAVGALGKMGVQRFDVLARGGLRDDALLQALVAANLARAGIVIRSDASEAEIVSRLERGAFRDLPVHLPGASFVTPTSLRSVQAGDEVMVFATLHGLAPFRIGLGGATPATLPERAAERPLLERAVAKAKIETLLARKQDAAVRSEVTRLSLRHRVLSPFTSLLVLETEGDYQRYGLARESLTDVLTVENGRLTVAQRGRPQPGKAGAFENVDSKDGTRWPESNGAQGRMWGDELGETFGSGGLGISGIGEGGGGLGEGRARSSARPALSAPRLRTGATTVSGRLPTHSIQRIVQQYYGLFRACYQVGLLREPTLTGRVVIRFVIGRDGGVIAASDAGSAFPDARVVRCLRDAMTQVRFPAPEGGIVTVVYPLVLIPDGVDPATVPPLPSRGAPTGPPELGLRVAVAVTPYTGAFREVMAALAARNHSVAEQRVTEWRKKSPGDVMALLALGEVSEAQGATQKAARAYGSIVDLFQARADLRRYAGARLEHLADPTALALAVDTFEKARKDRPDHATGYRQSAYALLAQKQFAAAFEVLAQGLGSAAARDRAGVGRVLREDLGLIAAAWSASEPARREDIHARLTRVGGSVERGRSLRFVLGWETDTNDVDLHVYDDRGGHAYFSDPKLPSGGMLYADVTNGYGPEVFTVRGAPRGIGYKLRAHYYARGPQGFGMGKLQIIEHDGQGGLRIEVRPFVVMLEQAYVELGSYPAG